MGKIYSVYYKLKNKVIEAYNNFLILKLKQTEEEFKMTRALLDNNSKDVLRNFNKYNSFLLYGDTQSGKTNNLINISLNLLEEDQIDIIIYLTGNKNNLLTQNQERFFDTFEGVNNNYLILKNKKIFPREIEISLDRKNKVILNSLKTSYRLNHILNLVSTLSQKNRFLIINDEADEASLSKISKSIFQKLMSRGNCKFLNITASPFANLYNNHDFYDYYKIFKSPKDYYGIDKFWNKIKIKNDIDESLKYSIWKWIYSTSINKLDNSQLLINIDVKTKIHWNIKKHIVLKELPNIKTKQSIKYFLKKLLQISDEDIEENIIIVYEFVKNLKSDMIKISNSTKESNEVDNYGHEIIIGGNKLSRGLTFKHLIVELMINKRSKAKAGTLIQRARWLGYREKIINHMEIIVNENAYKALKEVEHLIKITKGYSLINNNYRDQVMTSSYKYIEV